MDGARAAFGAAAILGVSAGCDGAPLAMASSTSPFSTWPRLPEPATWSTATLASASSFAAAGAGGILRSVIGVSPAIAADLASASLTVDAPESPAACATAPGFELGLFLRLFLRRRLGGSAACPDLAEQRADADRLAVLGGDLRQRARGRRRHLDRHLVGFELDQRLIGGDGVADLLEPLADGRLGDRFAKRGDADFGSHFSYLSVAVLQNYSPSASSRRAASCARCFDIMPVAGEAAAGRPV